MLARIGYTSDSTTYTNLESSRQESGLAILFCSLGMRCCLADSEIVYAYRAAAWSQTEHGRMPSSNMLLLNLILLIEVTFSPTPDFVN
jgi:hypothetical protein